MLCISQFECGIAGLDTCNNASVGLYALVKRFLIISVYSVLWSVISQLHFRMVQFVIQNLNIYHGEFIS